VYDNLYFIDLALILIFLVLAKRLAGKSISDIIYLVMSGILNLNSISQSIQTSTFVVEAASL